MNARTCINQTNTCPIHNSRELFTLVLQLESLIALLFFYNDAYH